MLQLYGHRRFLLDDRSLGDPNRLLIFATFKGFDILCASDHWFADGTLEVSPTLFFQNYTLCFCVAAQ